MQSETRIIVDSTADLVPKIKERVYTVPLTVHFGQEEYIDGVTIDHKTFYEKLVESDVLPTTSQATPNDFIGAFETARQAGEAAVVITLASKFSGTYQSAVIAAAEYENIYVVDGASAAMGTGISGGACVPASWTQGCLRERKLRRPLEEEKKKIVMWWRLVDTLEYLKRGGRISKTAAFAGGSAEHQARDLPSPTARSTCWGKRAALRWGTICSFRRSTRRAALISASRCCLATADFPMRFY